MIGPGKYDDLCTYVRENSGGFGAAVIVIDGTNGMGFSIQMPPSGLIRLAGALRTMSDTILQDIVQERKHEDEKTDQGTQDTSE